jgi:hypothetical protein
MEKRKPLSVMQLLSKIQYDMTRRSKYDPIGYADLVEEKMKEKRELEAYNKSLEEKKKRSTQKLVDKIQKQIDNMNEERRSHPEKYKPVYWGNSSG